MSTCKIFNICITGGPCAGKTSILALIRQELEDLGLNVVFSSEVATDLIQAGLTPSKIGAELFQTILLEKMFAQERFFNLACQKAGLGRTIIIYDRGAMDTKAYVGDQTFERILKKLHCKEVYLRDKRYDGVIFLRSVAVDKPHLYTVANNSARSETAEQAKQMDVETLRAWTGTPHLAIIDNSTDLIGKARRTVQEICRVIGVPVPTEIERKYLVKDLDLKCLPTDSKAIEITQTYLISDQKHTHERVRTRGHDGSYCYFHTKKEKLGPGVNLEEERQIDYAEYCHLLGQKDPELDKIQKIRYCFVYENQYFELDVFQQPVLNLVLLEIELTDLETEVRLPDWLINKAFEVTSDPRFSNLEIARNGE
jgi:CYTH domain-containing protein/thymidylate kinase